MRCRDVHALATRFVDGELDDARASALRGHLRGCDGCRARIEDEALLRDAGADLGPIDPPTELWQGIQRRLAEAEVADAGRSRAWLLWQRLRPHALTGAVVTAAAGVLLVWALRRGDDGAGEVETAVVEPLPSLPPGAALPSLPPEGGGPGWGAALPGSTFEELRVAEIAKTDSTYDGVIVELRQIVAEERASWSPAAARRFDARMAALEAEAGKHRRVATVDPAGRDPLYATLRAQIALLERAAMGELPR